MFSLQLKLLVHEVIHKILFNEWKNYLQDLPR